MPPPPINQNNFWKAWIIQSAAREAEKKPIKPVPAITTQPDPYGGRFIRDRAAEASTYQPLNLFDRDWQNLLSGIKSKS